MMWSNWQGAIWRGAMVGVFLWSGLAWTQTPAPAPAGPERFMVVHENGRSTRCRVLESWQLPDRRIAHLLQSVASGELITIVDEHAPAGDVGDAKNARAMIKRIISWGAGKRTPPEGSPIPPQMLTDAGLVLKHEISPPALSSEPAIINRKVDEKGDGSTQLTSKDQAQIVEFNPPIIDIGGDNSPPPSAKSAPLPSGPPAANNLPSIPQVQKLTPNTVSNACEPATNPRLVAQPIGDLCPPTLNEFVPGTIIVESGRKSWRPGDKLQSWLLNKSMPRSTEVAMTQTPVEMVTKSEATKTPFSTAMPMATLPSAAPEGKKPEPAPLAIATPPAGEKWGGPVAPNQTPGKSDTAAKPEPKVDPLLAPDRITPNDDALKSKPAAQAPMAPPTGQWPLNTQSVLAAKSGIQGPVTYVPYPVVTVPQPHRPPMPPDPKLPDAPQLNAFVNAFSPPPMPKGQANPGQPSMMPQGNPMLAQQQMMQQQMMHQQMMAHRNMMPGQMPSQGPMANYSRQYQGPMPPNLVPVHAPMQSGYSPAPYAPQMPPQQPMLQPISYQQPTSVQHSPVAHQIEQMIKIMRESPYPAQREWAAQQMVNFDWRTNPQILPALLQSATYDPAVSVRAGCVYCLGRMQASVEPVLGALHALRYDADPRVRQEVERTLVRLGQTPATAQ